MSKTGGHHWTRRRVLGGVALLALGGGAVTVAKLRRSGPDEEPTPRQQALLSKACQLVIPHTGTAGAGEVGSVDFVILALTHGLLGARDAVPAAQAGPFRKLLRADGSLLHLAWLEHELDQRSGGDFLKRSGVEQIKALTALDAEAFAQHPDPPSPWKVIKALILTGYYTSEVGGSEELAYELVPGRWDPDIALEPGARAWSSDWTAVDFG